MLKPDTGQTSFFGDMIYDRLFQKRSHWLKDLLQVVDFSFINDLCQDLYEATTGRPAWSPDRLFKVAFLQFCYDISDRRVEEELAFSLIFRYFVGLEADEEPPDPLSGSCRTGFGASWGRSVSRPSSIASCRKPANGVSSPTGCTSWIRPTSRPGWTCFG